MEQRDRRGRRRPDAVQRVPRGRDPLERIASATTDMQHIVHQGLTYYGAAFWVGANAGSASAALDDIVETVLRRRLDPPALHQGPHGHRGHRIHIDIA